RRQRRPRLAVGPGIGEILRDDRVEDGVDPVAVPEVRLALPPLAHEAGALGMRAGALVEGVDLELEPVVPELLEQKLLEEPSGLVREPATPEAWMHGEVLEAGDPIRLVRDVIAERSGPLAIQPDHEPAEGVRLGERALDLLEDLLPARRRAWAEEL